MYLKCYILQNIKYLNFKMYNNSIKIINKNYFINKKIKHNKYDEKCCIINKVDIKME